GNRIGRRGTAHYPGCFPESQVYTPLADVPSQCEAIHQECISGIRRTQVRISEPDGCRSWSAEGRDFAIGSKPSGNSSRLSRQSDTDAASSAPAGVKGRDSSGGATDS